MEGNSTPTKHESEAPTQSARRLFWASAAFYVLIAFEFFYMASPFAAYFYAVYGPGMDWLQGIGLADWTLWFFLPHVVSDTRSMIINSTQAVGVALFFGGLLVFAGGVFQVYRAKLRKSDAVMGGLYRFIRHPQYTALIVASVGMLLVWPRFLVLFSTITVIFAYIALARAEEKICLRQYPGYADYMKRTGMFFPKSWMPWSLPRLSDIANPWAKALAWVAIIAVVASVSTAAAFGVRSMTIASLIKFETSEGVYLSVIDITDEELAKIADTARNAPAAQAALSGLGTNAPLLAYVLPTQMYVSEIPMHLPEGEKFGHTIPKDRDPARYKVIFTVAEFGTRGVPSKERILANAVNKRPLIEVHVNLTTNAIETTYAPPADAYYNGRQVPIF